MIKEFVIINIVRVRSKKGITHFDCFVTNCFFVLPSVLHSENKCIEIFQIPCEIDIIAQF